MSSSLCHRNIFSFDDDDYLEEYDIFFVCAVTPRQSLILLSYSISQVLYTSVLCTYPDGWCCCAERIMLVTCLHIVCDIVFLWLSCVISVKLCNKVDVYVIIVHVCECCIDYIVFTTQCLYIVQFSVNCVPWVKAVIGMLPRYDMVISYRLGVIVWLWCINVGIAVAGDSIIHVVLVWHWLFMHITQSAAHLYEQFLQVQQIGFVTLGPLHRV